MTPATPSSAQAAPPRRRRPWGLRLILLYKFTKGPLMLALAVWLTAAPAAAYHSVEALARELAEAGAVWARAGNWIDAQLTLRVIVGAAILAWLDGISTTIEGVLLWSGKPWAEWIVIMTLALLLPVELASLEHRPGLVKALVLLLNTVIVIYLAHRRIQEQRAARRSKAQRST